MDEHPEKNGGPDTDEKHAYVCHCAICGGMVACVVEGTPDTPEEVRSWLGLDNTYVQRRPVDETRDLEWCDATFDD